MAKGHKTGGRVKGVPNKFNADIKGMIIGALSAQGGQEWLEKQMSANPVAFMGLIGKVLPTTLVNDPDAPLSIQIISGVPRQADYQPEETVNGHSPSH